MVLSETNEEEKHRELELEVRREGRRGKGYEMRREGKNEKDRGENRGVGGAALWVPPHTHRVQAVPHDTAGLT